mmetsp:Transcript_14471/g.36625  ORF Transcript_14471/g.36625 Transcript_14471/m.36625 type:complete len:362 (+) Transcript_14471:466-1551(+)
MGGCRLRVKAAYVDKPSGRSFDNLTPVSTWVEECETVAQLLPVLARRFWSGVETEVLDDDAHLPQPESLKAVTVTFNGSLVLKDDNLFDVLSAETSDRDNVITVGIKGAAEYLPKTASTPSTDTATLRSPPGSVPWGRQGSVMLVQPQGAAQQQGNRPHLLPMLAPVDHSAMISSNGKPNTHGLTAVPNGNGPTAGDGNVMTWAGMDPHFQLLQVQQQQQDGAAGAGSPSSMGRKRSAERDNKCPLPFLRDISNLAELYDRWEAGMDGQPPLKMLSGTEYRGVRTRYHEIKNFVLRLKERAALEAGGDDKRMAAIMQHELEAARTQQGSKMGLPSWVRMTANQYVKDIKARKMGSQSPITT